MKTGSIWRVALSMAASIGSVATARADSASAHCEVRKDGETHQGASGPCIFSQRQGHINLDLRDGTSFSFTPADRKGTYHDQQGNEVTRTVSDVSDVFKWENGRQIILTYDAGPSTPVGGAGTAVAGPQDPSGSAAATRNDGFGTVCGVIAGGKIYRYRCTATDVYSGDRKVRTILRYPDQTIELTWRSAKRVGLQFEGMMPQEARYATAEGETNFVFEDKTYFYYSDKQAGRMESAQDHVRAIDRPDE